MTQSISKTSKDIQEWLVNWLSKELECEAKEINIKEPFVNLGLSSRQAIILIGELEDWLKFGEEEELDPSLAWEYPSIAQLSEYLADYLARF